jgi:glycerol-3-phosphate dehydrogenase
MSEHEQIYDIAIIGGGINGAGIAADAAGRGLKVFLCEQTDFAAGTSSTSSKLIHGGLRYLEHYEFRLVKEALAEREVLLNKAPHLVSPLKFTLPHRPHLRPAWMIRSGLFLYDHLSRRNSLPRAKKVKFSKEHPLRDSIKTGFEYYDCWVDDSRLVISNILDASRRGADIRAHTACEGIRFVEESKAWTLSLRDRLNQNQSEVRAHNIVNASGPWLNNFLEHAAPEVPRSRNIRLIKGSHIVVPRTLQTQGAYILQNEDKRIVFVLPYQDDFSIIGTTDKEYYGDPKDVAIEDWEVDYLLSIYNQHFELPLSKQDIVSTYSGVRPLCDDESDDPSAITRDYTLELHEHSSESAVLSIYGGKITTYRKLAEAAMKSLQPYLKESKGWTAKAPLPGAEHFGQTFEQVYHSIATAAPWLELRNIDRFAKSYGMLCLEFIRTAKSSQDLGEDFGSGLSQAEVDYLIDKEWARSAEDILWRRSKLGLRLDDKQVARLKAYVEERCKAYRNPSLSVVADNS